MSITNFKDGSTLHTGNDIYSYLLSSFNKRDNFRESCDFCKYNNIKTDRCNNCSIGTEEACSCHISAPCSKCERNDFEVTNFLINFENYGKGHKKWECFPSEEKIFNKFKLIEKEGFLLSAEILSTGEIAVYLESHNEEDLKNQLEICRRIKFKETVTKMIQKFKLENDKNNGNTSTL